MSDVIELLTEVFETDEVGNEISLITPKQVYADVTSVSRAEFFSAGEAGLKPAFVFKIFFGDYDGQRLVSYKGQQYQIYRTYIDMTNELAELYTEERVGEEGTSD